MIIEQNETTIAYRCPHCGSGIMSLVGVFRLNADRLVLKCQCQNSSMSLTKSKDGKVRIEVPCLVCRAPHNYTITEQLFFSNKLFLLPCHASGLDICFLGGQADVSGALERSAEQLRTMLEEAGIDPEHIFHSDEERKELPDAHVYDVVNFVVRELECEGRIHCDCETGPYVVYFGEDGESIVVECESCHASKTFPTDSVGAATDFLNTDEMILE